MSQLKRTLFDVYDGFADKRIKNLDKGRIYIVDDRADSDIGADRQLFGYFCMIFAEVRSETQVDVDLRGNVPDGPKVQEWLAERGLSIHGPLQPSLKFTVQRGEQDALESLATAIESIVAHGAPRYGVPNYKYVCRRTACSLRRLKDVLDDAWQASGG